VRSIRTQHSWLDILTCEAVNFLRGSENSTVDLSLKQGDLAFPVSFHAAQIGFYSAQDTILDAIQRTVFPESDETTRVQDFGDAAPSAAREIP
jgi:hypothetical protein